MLQFTWHSVLLQHYGVYVCALCMLVGVDLEKIYKYGSTTLAPVWAGLCVVDCAHLNVED